MPWIALPASTVTTRPSSATATSTSSSVKPRRLFATLDPDPVGEPGQLEVHDVAALVHELEHGGVGRAVALEHERHLTREHRSGGGRLDRRERDAVRQRVRAAEGAGERLEVLYGGLRR